MSQVLVPGPCKCNLTRKKGLCRCTYVKELEVLLGYFVGTGSMTSILQTDTERVRQ